MASLRRRPRRDVLAVTIVVIALFATLASAALAATFASGTSAKAGVACSTSDHSGPSGSAPLAIRGPQPAPVSAARC